jgi:hypothetical protein
VKLLGKFAPVDGYACTAIFHPSNHSIVYAVSSDEVVEINTDRPVGQHPIQEFSLYPMDPDVPDPDQPVEPAEKGDDQIVEVSETPVTVSSAAANQQSKSLKVHKNAAVAKASTPASVEKVPYGLDVTCQSNAIAISENGRILFLAMNFTNLIVAFDTETRRVIWYVESPLRVPLPDKSQPMEHAQSLTYALNEIWVTGWNIVPQRLSVQDGTTKGKLTVFNTMVFNVESLVSLVDEGERPHLLCLNRTLSCRCCHSRRIGGKWQSSGQFHVIKLVQCYQQAQGGLITLTVHMLYE